MPRTAQRVIWTSAVRVIDRPALTIFFRSISRPIMKRRKIRPSSEMAEMFSADSISPDQAGPRAKPPIR